MEETSNSSPSNTQGQDTTYSPGKQLLVGFSVLAFLLVIGFLGYSFINKNVSVQTSATKPVLGASTNQISPVQNSNPIPQTVTESSISSEPTSETNPPSSKTMTNTCSKNGPAQKWEYLVPYTVKDGDTLQSIAASQLNDATRVNEIVQLNGQGPFVVGSTLYLPPAFITKSSGNIQEVYGMLTAKDSSYWHINYSSDANGIGIIIPSFWFDGVTNSDSIAVGDCIKVLFDNGNKVYSVSEQ